jgi:hypothetical protein
MTRDVQDGAKHYGHHLVTCAASQDSQTFLASCLASVQHELCLIYAALELKLRVQTMLIMLYQLHYISVAERYDSIYAERLVL